MTSTPDKAKVDGRFRRRGHHHSRIEFLSDAVFGFGVALLAVSLEVPRTYAELVRAMRGFIAFGLAFAILMNVWFSQHKFFRRYGLENAVTVAWNALLLFVILFYIYPLKFVFTALFESIFYALGVSDASQPDQAIGPHASMLMIIYAIGYLAVQLIFVELYRHAYSRRKELNLAPIEEFDTRMFAREHLWVAVVPLLSIVIVLVIPARWGSMCSGLSYGLIGVAEGLHHDQRARRRKKLFPGMSDGEVSEHAN